MPRWTHTDLELAARIGRGEARARSGDWQSGTLNERLADLRAYMLASLAAQADLVGATTTTAERATVDVRAGTGIDPGRVEVAAALARTWEALAAGNTYPGPDLATVAAPSAPPETGAIQAAVVIVVALGIAAAACYVAYQGADVIDRQLARLTKAKELLQADETLKHLVDGHAAQERDAGKALPLSSATREALDLLRARQNELLKEPQKRDPATTLAEGGKWALILGAAVLAWSFLRPARSAT